MRRRNNYNRNRNKDREKKERLIMLGSAVFVLTALTMTGVYVKGNNDKQKNDGYTIDFTALQESADKKSDEIIYQTVPAQEQPDISSQARLQDETDNGTLQKPSKLSSDDFMDYLPPVESSLPGEKSNVAAEAPIEEEPDFAQAAEFLEREEELSVPTDGEAVKHVSQPALQFTEQDTLVWPIVGNVLINYSMDKTTYFATLEQYKYSPAIVIGATEGETITAAADGRVADVSKNEEIGNFVVMDLGGGYELTYGQLENIQVSEGSYIKTGESIGTVAAPTKYYSVEGANVYFKLTKDGNPVNPMGKLN